MIVSSAITVGMTSGVAEVDLFPEPQAAMSRLTAKRMIRNLGFMMDAPRLDMNG
jgi:hypothetical protein